MRMHSVGCRLLASLLSVLLMGCTATPALPPSAAAPPPTVAPTLPVPSARVRSAPVRQVSSGDIAYAQDERALVQTASLVVVGTPTGPIEERATTPDGMLTTFHQSVRVHQVLKGQITADTVRVLRAGLSRQAQRDGVVSSTDVRGPLTQAPLILFLQPSAEAEVFQVVGHASGELPLDMADRVAAVRPETQAFAQLDVAAVRTKIAELSARP